MGVPTSAGHALSRLSLVAVLLALGSCGGGGDSASLSPPPPATGLQVTASASQVTAGGGEVILTATRPNSSHPVIWSISGPGTINASRGDSIRYLPPGQDQLLVPSSVTFTASSRELIQSLTIPLRPSPNAPRPVPGTSWEIVRPAMNSFSDLKLLNGRFFVCSMSGAILNSTDGIVWTPRITPLGSLRSITYGNGTYLAVGRDTVLKSSDGDTWVSAGIAPGLELTDVAAGNGVFVAAGSDGLSRSVDGSAWSRVSPPDTISVSSVAFGAGRFVAIGDINRVHHSSTGTQWTTQTLASAKSLQSIAFGGGVFLVLGEDKNFRSTDGETWTEVPKGISRGFRLRYGDGRFFAVDRDDVWESTDGVAWRLVHKDFSSGFVVGMAINEGRYVIADSTGALMYRREDATSLTDAVPGTQWPLIAALAVEDTFYALSEAGDVLRSQDGRTWSANPERLPVTGRGIAYGNGSFVVVSDGGRFAAQRSEDSRRWTDVELAPSRNRLASVTFGNGRFVAGGTSGQIFHSADGLGWTRVTTPITVELPGVAFGNGRFVAVSVQGSVIASSDLNQWTTQLTGAGRLHAVAHGPAGFVAVGGIVQADIWTSLDGLTWTRRDLEQGTPGLAAVAYGNGKYIATGGQGALLISDDGIRWERRSAGIHSALVGVAAMGGRFVAVGEGGSIVMSAQ